MEKRKARINPKAEAVIVWGKTIGQDSIKLPGAHILIGLSIGENQTYQQCIELGRDAAGHCEDRTDPIVHFHLLLHPQLQAEVHWSNPTRFVATYHATGKD